MIYPVHTNKRTGNTLLYVNVVGLDIFSIII